MEFFSANLNPQLGILAEVAIAMLLGGLIGLERELSEKPAGFRTHMLVAGAAALLVGLADILVLDFSTKEYANVLRVDPIRIVEAIITGISFLGAGMIFRSSEGDWVKGLTTAASILWVSAIGITVALEQFVLAAGATLLSLLVLRVMNFLDHVGKNKRS